MDCSWQESKPRRAESAVRLLKNIFRCGLFENPYLDPEDLESTKCGGIRVSFKKRGKEDEM